MLKFSYKGYVIYTIESKYLELGKSIINRKYKILETYKNDKRSLVLKIELKNKKYVLKSPLNESARFIKKIKTLFRESEVMRTLKNITNLRNEGLKELYIPYLAIEKRQNGLLKESFILTEYIDGRVIKNYKDFQINEKKQIVKILENIHNKNIYHGDANHGNFIFTDSGIRVIDTTGKKEKLWNYKRNYDFITLNDCIEGIYELHDFKKNEVSYWLAYYVKKLKKRNR